MANVRSGSIVLKNSCALPDRALHRNLDISGCATHDASEPVKGSTTPKIHSESRAKEFFNTIGQNQSLDDPVGAQQDGLRDRDALRSCGLEIDN